MDHGAVALAIAELAGEVTGIERSDGFVPDTILPPHFYVADISIDYDQTFGGLEVCQYTVRVLVSHAPADEAQALLHTFLRRTGPTSIKAAIDGPVGVPQTLGGLIDDLHVRKLQGLRMYTVGDRKHPGAEWQIRVVGTEEEE